jgi:hypothetical protein
MKKAKMPSAASGAPKMSPKPEKADQFVRTETQHDAADDVDEGDGEELRQKTARRS